MRRSNWVLPSGIWPLAHEAGTVTLAWDDRHRRRIRLRLDGGGDEILLDLAATARLGEGDGLLLEDGAIVRVIAAPEPVLEIRAGNSALPRLAYHLGNRHLPIEILPELLIIRQDHVIEDMLRRLGAEITPALLPFTPEPGAYGGGHSHDHEHQHPHEH
jgi:urease accessory protein